MFSHARYKSTIALSSLLLCSATVYAGNVQLTELREPRYLIGEPLRYNDVDFDGDGRHDTVYVFSRETESVVHVVGNSEENQLKIKQRFRSIPGIPATWIAYGKPHFGVVTTNSISIYSGWPLALSETIELELPLESQTLFVKDINNDGVPEVVRYGIATVAVNSLATGQLLWSIERQSPTYFRAGIVAQLDSDPALELAFNDDNNMLHIVDGSTFHVTSHFMGLSSSGSILAGRFIDGDTGILVTGQTGHLFRTTPWETIWTRRPADVGGAQVGDLDLNGTDEVVHYKYPSEKIHVMDVQSLTTRTLATESDTVYISLADVDGDSAPEILTFGHSDGFTTIKVIDSASGLEQSRIREPSGSALLTAASRNSSPDDYFVVLSTYGDGHIRRENPLTGEAVWTNNYRNFDGTTNKPMAIAIVDRGLSGREEIMITGFNGNGYGVLTFFDAENGSHLRTFRLPGGVESSTYPNDSLAVTDEDGSAISVLTCHLNRIREYDYRDGALLWTSPVDHSCRNLWRLRSGEIVASNTGGQGRLTAYDQTTREQLWTGPAFPSDVPDGPWVTDVWLISPVDAPEQFAVLMNDRHTIHFIEASTRLPIRTIHLINELPWMPGSELIALPGGSIRHLLLYSGRHLQIIDGIDGRIHATSQNIGYFEEHRYGISAVQASTSEYIVSLTSTRGHTVFSLRVPSDPIFSDSFDLRDELKKQKTPIRGNTH